MLDWLVAAGLVERATCDDDKRGYSVRITGDGRKLRREMWPVYHDRFRRDLADRLTAEDTKTLAGILAQLYPPE